MVIIKKLLSILLVIAVIAAVFAGCTKPVDESEASPFSVYRIKDGIRISLGDKRENIEKIIDARPEVTVEFADDTPDDQVFESVAYEDIAFDYTRAGVLLGIDVRADNWKIANGLRVTNSTEDIKRHYSTDYMYTYRDIPDLYLAMDDDGNLIDFAEDAPYILRFNIEQHAILRILIKKNVPQS